MLYVLARQGTIVRVFAVKSFRRFQRKEKIDDEVVSDAIRRAERGQIDDDLGGGLIKQRVARKGQGRSGGYRTIIAYRKGDRAAVLLCFAKSDRDNIDETEHRALVRLGGFILQMTEKQLADYMSEGQMSEIDYDDES